MGIRGFQGIPSQRNSWTKAHGIIENSKKGNVAKVDNTGRRETGRGTS